MNSKTIKVVCLKSPQALFQVQGVFEIFSELDYSIIGVDSYEDIHTISKQVKKLHSDIIMRELNTAILDGKADILIHSANDLPYPLSSNLEVIALLNPIQQKDSWLSRNSLALEKLPPRAKGRNNSISYQFQLLSIPPDVEVASILYTTKERISTVNKDDIDAHIFSAYDLKRMRLKHFYTQRLQLERNSVQNVVIVARSNRLDLKSIFSQKDIRKNYGKVTLVGFGPGNPDLLTLGGDKALAKADIIFHDDLLDKNYLSKYNAVKINVGKRKGRHSIEQSDLNLLLLNAAKAGKQVIRLKGGDPMIFAHGGEEIEYLQNNFVEVDIIPGVSSGIAVAALTKVPLTHRGIASTVTFISGHSNVVQIPKSDTLVYFMAGSNIRLIAKKAIEQGKNPKTPVMLTYNVSMPNQQEFFSNLEKLANNEMKYPTPVIIVIGDVVALKHNAEKAVLKPLILVTGTDKEQYEKIGKVIHQPLIQIERIDPNPELNNQLNQLNQFDWLFFTSRYAVNFFFESLLKNGKDSRTLIGIKIAAIGNLTSEALHHFGIIPDLLASEESSQGLLKDIATKNITRGKVLLPRSNIGLPFLPDGLRKLGWEVTTLSIYRNSFPENLKPVDLTKVLIIVFSSPSCVTNFKRLYGHFPTDKEYIFRGKETEKEYKKLAT